MARILIVEDEVLMAEGLTYNLEEEGHDVRHVTHGEEALERLAGQQFDLILLDVMLPQLDGYRVARQLRARGDMTPVLMLTARRLPEDVIEGIESGADDYMTKPFDLRELLVRVGALLRRAKWYEAGTATMTELTFGPNRVDFRTFEASAQGEHIELTSKEAMIMRYFAEHAGEVVTREDLLDAVWCQQSSIKTRTVDNFIMRLRRYFEERPDEPHYLLTVRGAGYRFEPEG